MCELAFSLWMNIKGFEMLTYGRIHLIKFRISIQIRIYFLLLNSSPCQKKNSDFKINLIHFNMKLLQFDWKWNKNERKTE